MSSFKTGCAPVDDHRMGESDTMATDVCRNCGARLSPDIDWCGQCYARVPSSAAPIAPASLPSPDATVAAPVAADPVPDVQGDLPVLPDVDLQLAVLRAGTRPVSKSALIGWLSLMVVLSFVAELALTLLHGVALAVFAAGALVAVVVLVRALWQRARPAVPTR